MSKVHGNSIKNVFGLSILLSCAKDHKFVRNLAILKIRRFNVLKNNENLYLFHYFMYVI